MAEIDARIPLGIQPPQLMSPFEVIGGAQKIRNNQLTNAIEQRKLGAHNALAGLYQQTGGDPAKMRAGLIEQGYGEAVPELEKQQAETQKVKLEGYLQKTKIGTQLLAPLVGKPDTPETRAQYKSILGQLTNLYGEHPSALPMEYEPQAVMAGYQQGMSVHDQLQEQYQAISAVGGYRVFNKATGQFQTPQGEPIFAPNASPELAGQTQQQKEMYKGIKATNEQGQEYYAPQGQVNQAFINPGNMRPQGANTGFQQFNSPEEGLSAIDKNLQAYGQKGINTLAGVVSRWSPPNENDTERLIVNASKRLGIDPNRPIDLNNPLARHAIATAIMLQEHGSKGLFGAGDGIVKSPSIAQKNQADITKIQQMEQAKTQADLGKQQQIKIRDSKEALNLLGNIERLLPESTGSGFGAAVDKAAAYTGKATSGAKAIAALATNAKKLVMMMPRGAGHQSDRDIQLAEQMAGDLANQNLPVETRQAALAELKRVTSQYIPGANVSSGYSPKTQQPASAGIKFLGFE